jgi:phenylalanyl-tRNA synthetase beta chain
MKAPLSWINDYVNLADLSIEEVAVKLTMLGLEVDGILLVGLAKPTGVKHQFKYEGLSWPADKFVVAQVNEVLPHPNADKLVLCRLEDGQGEHIVLTGAPNLYDYKGIGELAVPLKVAYAREGAELYDGHQPGQVLTRLKRAVIRGVESTSMICSEKELGISAEHEGVILLDADAPSGMPLAEYMGDAVFDISILPNMARDASIIGIARELAAVLRRPLCLPEGVPIKAGGAIQEKVSLEVHSGQLNPRFMLGMVENAQPQLSPYQVRRRLSLAGMRPIDALVDATNYTMLDTGEPLHAFDYDLLAQRAGGKPVIITRPAQPGEQLTTLDGETHRLDETIEVVADTRGPLSLAGIMGGAETGVSHQTQNVLVEAAAWNFINIRQTVSKLKINSEASYRFSRNVHPALAETALSLCLRRMVEWSGGTLVQGVWDVYSQKWEDPTIRISEAKIRSLLGVEIPLAEAAEILSRLGFDCQNAEGALLVTTPPTRTDIEPGLVGEANLIEEISRIYGYDRIPAERLSDTLPPQVGNPDLAMEEKIRDLLIAMGLQDTVAYRQTSPEREARLNPGRQADATLEYVRIKNPITPERTVMRRSALATMLELLEHNGPFRPGLAMFELGPVFIPVSGSLLPFEAKRLSIGLMGTWEAPTWHSKASPLMDFYDLKGIVEELLRGLHLEGVHFQAEEDPAFHPGKCARVYSGETLLGTIGEIHPLVRKNYEFVDTPVLAGELDADQLIRLGRDQFINVPLPPFPWMREDIAVVVDETVSADQLEQTIRQAGGKLLIDVRLFDIFRSEKLGVGKKSMAYQLTYQAPDRTLTDKDAETIRKRIIRALERELGAALRS